MLAFLAVGAAVWIACSSIDEKVAPNFDAGGTEKCSDDPTFVSDDKDEIGPTWSITAGGNQVITEVCVKAGPKVYYSTGGTISVNGTQCFTVTGIGTPTVTVSNAAGHIENICKSISNIETTFGPAPSPSPSPSPT
jgi:hypothetical protein